MNANDHRLLHHRADLVRDRYPALHQLTETMVNDPDEQHQLLFDLMLDVLEHDHLLDHDAYGELWSTVLEALGANHRPSEIIADAIVLNALGLLALGRARDFRDLVFLVELAGHETVAAVHQRLDYLAQSVSGLPWTTRLIRRLCSPQSFLREEPTRRTRTDLSATELAVCSEAATSLLLHDLEQASGGVTDPILTVAGFTQLIEHGNAHQWRCHLATIAADPWSEHAKRLGELARGTELPDLATTFTGCIQRFRSAIEVDERRVIADRVRELVRISGLSQRAFAARIGTSASRMSTYVNGQVTPSAAMLLRMTRAAATAAGSPGKLDLLAHS